MEPDKDTTPPTDGETPNEESQAPADALSRTPDDLEQEQTEQAAANPDAKKNEPAEKKISPVKKLFRKVNLYFLIFLLLVVVAAVIAAVSYLNSQKAPVEPNIANQELTQEALKQLANSDATVGSAAQTLTIQGNAIIAGQTLMRGNLNIAGNLQTGGSIQGPTLNISGQASLGATQINDLQVATNVAIQGATTMRDLSVSGASSFSGPMTASQITVSRLILSGSGTLQLTNHLSFTGPSPGRSIIGSGILGSGGTVSLNGSDTSGSINLNSGNSPNGAGCIVRINFQLAFPSQPRVIISPVNSAAGGMDYYVERNNSGFSLCTNNAPSANKVFSFDYFVAG